MKEKAEKSTAFKTLRHRDMNFIFAAKYRNFEYACMTCVYVWRLCMREFIIYFICIADIACKIFYLLYVSLYMSYILLYNM